MSAATATALAPAGPWVTRIGSASERVPSTDSSSGPMAEDLEQAQEVSGSRAPRRPIGVGAGDERVGVVCEPRQPVEEAWIPGAVVVGQLVRRVGQDLEHRGERRQPRP